MYFQFMFVFIFFPAGVGGHSKQNHISTFFSHSKQNHIAYQPYDRLGNVVHLKGVVASLIFCQHDDVKDSTEARTSNKL
ncbi:hypothetical protein P8452_30046 [Trifolium repens]|nr:hypothetical protein P8452_30046 [Trifolium repens]